MEKLHFRDWLKTEVADFGFDRPAPPFDPNAGNLPVYPFKVDYVVRQLRQAKVGSYSANQGFLNDAHWGDGFGALRVNFSPYGGLRCTIQRQTVDIEGKPAWICKRVLEITDYHLKYPVAMISEIIDNAREVERENVEVGVHNFHNLEDLTKRIANYVERRTKQRIFMYQGIREVKHDREYIIHWGVTGMGVQRQDQQRLDQFQIIVKYDEETGLIRIGSLEVGGPIKSHRWEVDPSDFFEFFSPSQETSEICDSVLVNFNSY